MGKKLIFSLVLGVSSLMGIIGTVNASFIVEQYDDFWSKDLNLLKKYAADNTASTTAVWDYIDFTDTTWFSGDINGSNSWPSADALNAAGTDHVSNDTFFARITGDFFVGTAGEYSFKTYSDDGVFLYVDDILTINDPNLHAVERRIGAQNLSTGLHSVELYFFENRGAASLEFTLSQGTGDYTHFNDAAYQAPVPEPATMILFGIGLLSLAGVVRRKQK